MTPDEFIAEWSRFRRPSQLVRTDQTAMDSRGLSGPTKTWLLTAGLPEETAPFLSFQDAKKLPRIYELWGSLSSWTADEQGRLKRYSTIGSDGEGNPICLDEAAGETVVLLDHENRFEPLAFVNSSVEKLACCLLAYKRLVEEIQLELGESAWIDGKTSNEKRDGLARQLRQIDPPAMQQDCFWEIEWRTLPKESD